MQDSPASDKLSGPAISGDSARIFVVAGGTGGHLMPALFVAKEIKKQRPDADIEFIGTGRYLEKELIDPHFVRHEISAVGLAQKGIKGWLRFAYTAPLAIKQTWNLLRSRRPVIVIGFGGYVTFWPIVLASIKQIPCWIHEAERVPGLSNRVLARWCAGISMAFPDTTFSGQAKKFFTGHPVRAELVTASSRDFSGPIPSKLLILGGSQGSQALDKALAHLIPFLKQRNISLIHQCRPENKEKLMADYLKSGISAKVVTFIHKLEEAYRWADVVVSRAGAGAVAELEAINRPAILVPYPFSQGGHQKENAQYLISKGKALMVEEGNDFNSRLQQALAEILEEKNYTKMVTLPAERRALDASSNIAKECLKLLGN
jgi:UDP-N-acetylglucosamine--N-acetylmuramyl-(pentapeptide) pyrophosphoryl-undecaprenol N-acetylglucosamine transferase